MSLYAQNAQGSLVDWVFSGTSQRFPKLKIAYAESQVGWMPFQIERMDAGAGAKDEAGSATSPSLPSEQVAGPGLGLRLRRPHRPGQPRRGRASSTILFETDYPHSDGTFPHSRKIAHELFVAAGMDAEECYKVLRGNAIEAYGLARFGISK